MVKYSAMKLPEVVIVCILIILAALFIEFPKNDEIRTEFIPVKPSSSLDSGLRPSPILIKERPLISGDKLFERVNVWRNTNGYPEYKLSKFACSITEKRLPEIKLNWSHAGFYYKKYCENCYLSENLSKNFYYEADVPLVMDAWLNSPSHLENLKKDYSHGCIECESGFCVHIFSYF